MDFEQRNAAWNGWPREFHQIQSRSGVARVWTIQVIGNVIHTTWGQLGGKMQMGDERLNGVNVGKKNEMTPAAYALSRAKEMCRKKSWEGYREVEPHENNMSSKGVTYSFLDAPSETNIDFTQPLPLSLSFYKPDNSMSAALEKKARGAPEDVWYTRKRNGMMKVLVKNSEGELNIYSRRMLRQHDDEVGTEFTWDDRFHHLIINIEPHIPPSTILLGELVVEQDGIERFDLAQSYIKSLTKKAVAEMETSGLWPFFYCWDIAFWGGLDLVSTTPMSDRMKYISGLGFMVGTNVFRPLEVYRFRTPEEALVLAKERGFEGYVVIDPSVPGYGDKAYNFKGKPDRPGTSCAKLKPAWEDDFIAIWDPEKGYGERSTKGSRAGGIKSIGLYQYDKQGKLVFVANVNSGLTKTMLAELSDPRHFPQVWKIEYTGRRYVSEGEDTNALDFPRYISTRADKTPEECRNERL